MPAKREITRDDILDMPRYEQVRAEKRQALIGIKRHRRVEVGPFACFYFENYDTMWSQIHEMLRIEKGGEAQIRDELDAYNPLIPQGRDLVATFMIEIDDPVRRDRELRRLGHIEQYIALTVGDRAIAAESADAETERTTPDGKASSIHFLRFRFDDALAEAFRTPGTRCTLEIRHENYGHIAVLPEPVREALATDLA
jgi:hypothetical protein